MKVSEQIAALLGPTLLVLTLSEGVNLHVMTNTSPAVAYLNGGILFVAGLAILRAHNRWTFGWPVLVTLVGWAFLLGGFLWMFAPGLQQGMSHATRITLIAIFFIVATLLTIKAYVPDVEQETKTRSSVRRRRRKR